MGGFSAGIDEWRKRSLGVSWHRLMVDTYNC